MSSNGRRLEVRKAVSLPVRFRVRTSASLDMHDGETINISDHGAFLRTPRPLSVGDPLEVILTLPTELTGRGEEQFRCDARVVHVGLVEEPGACAAVGISIQRCTRVNESSRWTN